MKATLGRWELGSCSWEAEKIKVKKTLLLLIFSTLVPLFHKRIKARRYRQYVSRTDTAVPKGICMYVVCIEFSYIVCTLYTSS
jgi:hypothetical protein